MKEIIDMLDNYATFLKSLVASAFAIKNCCVDLHDENKVLKQLRALYVTNMVMMFVI